MVLRGKKYYKLLALQKKKGAQLTERAGDPGQNRWRLSLMADQFPLGALYSNPASTRQHLGKPMLLLYTPCNDNSKSQITLCTRKTPIPAPPGAASNSSNREVFYRLSHLEVGSSVEAPGQNLINGVGRVCRLIHGDCVHHSVGFSHLFQVVVHLRTVGTNEAKAGGTVT